MFPYLRPVAGLRNPRRRRQQGPPLPSLFLFTSIIYIYIYIIQ